MISNSKNNLAELRRIREQIKSLVNEEATEIASEFSRLSIRANDLKNEAPDYIPPWGNSENPSVTVNDPSENGTRRKYKVRNVGDAILEVLPYDDDKAMTLREICNAIKAAGMTYSYAYVSQKIVHYSGNSEYENQNGDCIISMNSKETGTYPKYYKL